MTGSAHTIGSDGGAGTTLPRRLGSALRTRVRNGDFIRWIGRAGAVIPVLALAFILVTLLLEALPVIAHNGWSFFTRSAWTEGNLYGKTVTTGGIAHPPGASYGALPAIVGTLATALIALLIAVPVSIGAALVIVERLPWVGSGIIGASVLGLGRALGETIAVAMVCGSALGAVPGNIYATMTTIAATIVSYLDSAFLDTTGFAVRTLAELGLVLMVITLAVNVLARFLVRKVSGTALPVGRGL